MKAHRASPLLSALIASLFIRSFSHHVIRNPEPLGCFYLFLFFCSNPLNHAEGGPVWTVLSLEHALKALY